MSAIGRTPPPSSSPPGRAVPRLRREAPHSDDFALSLAASFTPSRLERTPEPKAPEKECGAERNDETEAGDASTARAPRAFSGTLPANAAAGPLRLPPSWTLAAEAATVAGLEWLTVPGAEVAASERGSEIDAAKMPRVAADPAATANPAASEAPVDLLPMRSAPVTAEAGPRSAPPAAPAARAEVTAPALPAVAASAATGREMGAGAGDLADGGRRGTALRAARSPVRPAPLTATPSLDRFAAPPAPSLGRGAPIVAGPEPMAPAPAEAGLEAWETRIDGTGRPTGTTALRLEGPDGTQGVLTLRVRGEQVLATLASADPALTRQLERELPELRQSLRDRGIDHARVDVASASGASEAARRDARGETPGGSSQHPSERPSSRREADSRPSNRQRPQGRSSS